MARFVRESRFQVATGEYIAFLDSDDFYRPRRSSKSSFASSGKVGMVTAHY